MKRIGWQTYPTEFAEQALRDFPPPFLLILDPHLDLARSHRMTEMARKAGAKVAWRFVGFWDDRNPSALWARNVSPAYAARMDFNELSGNPALFRVRPDFLVIHNEPSTAGEVARWMADYYREAIPMWADLGIRLIGFNFATGNSPRVDPFPVIPGLVIGVHEYFDRGRPEGHILRFLQWAPPGSEIAITETGSEPRHEGLTLEMMRDYDARLATLAGYRVIGGAFFLLDSPQDWWAAYRMPRDWLPAFRKEEDMMADEIVRGIDVSAYTGPIRPDQIRLAAEKHNLELFIVQLHGGGPCGGGLNPHALSQIFSIREALGDRAMIGLYVWPPRAIHKPDVQAYFRAALSVSPIRFLALDVEAGEPVRREDVNRVRDLGVEPVIYSSPGEWAKVMKNSAEFADVTYWEANYIRKFRNALGGWNGLWPTTADRPWAPATRGGWKFSPLWQFFGTTRLEGILCDLNVAFRNWVRGGEE